MAPHSSTLAWKIPWMEEPGRLQSMGSLRVGHNRATSLSLFSFTHWRRKWQPTPVFLPGESQGRGSLVSCRLWGHTELDTTDVTQHRKVSRLYDFGRALLFYQLTIVAVAIFVDVNHIKGKEKLGENQQTCFAWEFLSFSIKNLISLEIPQS